MDLFDPLRDRFDLDKNNISIIMYNKTGYILYLEVKHNLMNFLIRKCNTQPKPDTNNVLVVVGLLFNK